MRQGKILDLAQTNRQPQLSPCAACGIRHLSICGELDSDQLSHLTTILSDVTVVPGQALFFESDPADHLYIIRTGCARVYKLLSDGRRMITGFLFDSDFIGLASNERYAYTAEAVTELTMCRYPRNRLEDFFEMYPSIETRMLRVATNELAAAQDQMVLLGRKTAQEKLASFLYLLSERAVRRGDSGMVLALPMNRTDIGDYLGLTIESVSRCFTQIRKSGAIELVTAHSVRILDKERLRDLTGSHDSVLEPHPAIL